jgi:CspA family cold shock protein
MLRGKIKTIDRARGFGFIAGDDGARVFFHQRWLKKIKFRDLNEGDEVIFEVNQGPRGPRAFNIALASSEENVLAETRNKNGLFKD